MYEVIEHWDREAELRKIRERFTTAAIPDRTIYRERPDPNVAIPQKGYGGDRILGRRDAVDGKGTEIVNDWKGPPAPPKPPPMGNGMHLLSNPGDPEVYSSTPRERAQGVQIYGGAPQLSDTVAGLQAVVAGLKQRDAARDAEMAEIKGALGMILKKLDAKPTRRPRKPASRQTKAAEAAR